MFFVFADTKVEEKLQENNTVPDTYESADQYINTWFPLIVQEMHAETINGIMIDGLGPCCEVRAESLA